MMLCCVCMMRRLTLCHIPADRLTVYLIHNTIPLCTSRMLNPNKVSDHCTLKDIFPAGDNSTATADYCTLEGKTVVDVKEILVVRFPLLQVFININQHADLVVVCTCTALARK